MNMPIQKAPWRIIIPNMIPDDVHVPEIKFIIIPHELKEDELFTQELRIDDDDGQVFNGILWLPDGVLSSWILEEFEKDTKTVIDMSPRQFDFECRNPLNAKYGEKLTQELFDEVWNSYNKKYEKFMRETNATVEGDDFFYANTELSTEPESMTYEHITKDDYMRVWTQVDFAQLDARSSLFGAI